MKYVVASDLHGSVLYTEKLVRAFEREKADLLILLGDIYYHGPRNPLPEDYLPKGVAEILNGIKAKIVVLKGNCDSAVDAMISEFDFIEDMVLSVNGKTVFLTHGHVFNKDAMSKTRYSAVLYGHFHTGFIERKNGVLLGNPGSVSLPKNGTPRSYFTLDDSGAIALKTLDGEVLREETI